MKKLSVLMFESLWFPDVDALDFFLQKMTLFLKPKVIGRLKTDVKISRSNYPDAARFAQAIAMIKNKLQNFEELCEKLRNHHGSQIHYEWEKDRHFDEFYEVLFQ